MLPREYKKNGVYADVIVVDPPRKGCDETLLETMVEMNPDRIVYVSCDSATLARDLKYLTKHDATNVTFWNAMADVTLQKNVFLHGEYAFDADLTDAADPDDAWTVSLNYKF